MHLHLEHGGVRLFEASSVVSANWSCTRFLLRVRPGEISHNNVVSRADVFQMSSEVIK